MTKATAMSRPQFSGDGSPCDLEIAATLKGSCDFQGAVSGDGDPCDLEIAATLKGSCDFQVAVFGKRDPCDFDQPSSFRRLWLSRITP